MKFNKKYLLIIPLLLLIVIAIFAYKFLLPPEVEFKTERQKFLLLEPLTVQFKSAEGLKLFNNDKEIGIAGSFPKTKEGYETVEIPVNDGDNKIQLYVQNQFGIKSQVSEYDIKSFNKEGYTREKCGNISFPLSKDLTIGAKNFDQSVNTQNLYTTLEKAIEEFNKSTIVCDDTVKLLIFKANDATIRCTNCDGSSMISDNISIYTSTFYKSVEEATQSSGKELLEKKEFVNEDGIKMIYTKTKEDTIVQGADVMYSSYYVFESKGKIYMLGISNSNQNIDLENYLEEIAMNLKIQ